MANSAWHHFMAHLLDTMFTNKMDRFTDYDRDSKIMFESIFMIPVLQLEAGSVVAKQRGGCRGRRFHGGFTVRPENKTNRNYDFHYNTFKPVFQNNF